MILKWVVVFGVFLGTSASAAVKLDAAWPDAAICERNLSLEKPNDTASLVAATDFVSWISLRHPILRDVIGRTNDLSLAFDLFYLTSGYHLAPSTNFGPGRLNRPFEHWLRTMTPRSLETIAYLPGKTKLDVAYLMSDGWKRTYAMRGKVTPNRAAIRRDRMWSMLSYAWLLLEDTLKSEHQVWNASNTADIEFQRLFLAPRLIVDFPRIKVRLNSVFTAYELESLRGMFASLKEDSVRIHVAHALDAQFDRIEADHRAMCRRLTFCTEVETFRRVYQATKHESALSNGPASTSALPPPKFEPEQVISFLNARRASANQPLDRASLFNLMSDLNRAADLLGKSLLHLEAWRTEGFPWAQWADHLSPSVESVRRLRFELSRRSQEIASAKTDFDVGSTVILGLADWVTRMNAQVVALDKNPEFVESLSRSEQISLGAIVQTLPPLVHLMERAVRSIDMRTEVMIQDTAAMSSLLMLVADFAEDRLRNPNDNENLDGSDKFEAIRNVLLESSERKFAR